jgi:hypothetical protein
MVTPTPVAVMTPKPSPTPLPYVNDQPLLPELGFQLGEVLDYRISAAEKPLADLQLNVQERRLYKERDSLLLTATITGVQPGVSDFVPGNQARVQVDPDTLAPRWSMTNFVSNFTGLKQTLTFDAKTGQVTFGKDKPVDAPIGTHTLLSLVYAMRSFNLKPSRDMGNPVNDTRVAVFWDAKPYVFTLRPSKPADIVINGETRSAQLVTVNTGDAKLDALGIKVWLSMEDRVPLRFSAGNYQADLIARRVAPIK